MAKAPPFSGRRCAATGSAAYQKGAVQTYLKEAKSKESEAFLLGILNSPDVVFTAAPHNTMRYARFMHERGTINILPQSWKDLFFPELHDRNGS